MFASRSALLLTIALLAGALAAPATAQEAAQPESLLSTATKTAMPDNVTDDTYAWISNHQALFFRLVLGPLTKGQQRIYGPMISSLPKRFRTGHFKLLVFDTTTGKTAPLEPFDREHPDALVALPGTVSIAGEPNSSWAAYTVPSYALSHNGEWLLWYKIADGRPEWTASRLDGGRELEWVMSGDDPVWQTGDTHWAEFAEGEQGCVAAVVHDLRDPASNLRVKVDPPVDGEAVGMAADGSLILASYDDDHPERSTKVTEITPDGSVANMRSYTVHVPAKMSAASDCALSPAGDRLAWIFDNYMDTLATGANATYEFYVSKLDGSDMHELGSMTGYTAPTEVNHQSYYFPEDLRWTPDSKHVSFIFRDALYVAPAP